MFKNFVITMLVFIFFSCASSIVEGRDALDIKNQTRKINQMFPAIYDLVIYSGHIEIGRKGLMSIHEISLKKGESYKLTGMGVDKNGNTAYMRLSHWENNHPEEIKFIKKGQYQITIEAQKEGEYKLFYIGENKSKEIIVIVQ